MTAKQLKKHLPHSNNTSGIFFLTWRIDNSQQAISSQEKEIISRAIRHDHNKQYLLLAYVIMDDHVHLLIEIDESQSLASIVKNIKSYSAHSIVKLSKRESPFWQKGYFDKPVTSDDQLIVKTNYILNNPLKKWPSIDDYKWAWSKWGNKAEII